MTLYKKRYRVESTRLPNWDYSTTAVYFVTICTQGRAHTLGTIEDGVFVPTEAGRYASGEWHDIPAHFPFVTLHSFVVMPNHVHGLLHISADLSKGGTTGPERAHLPTDVGDAHVRVSTEHVGRSFGPLQKNSLSLVINNYKAAVRRRAKLAGDHAFAWQPRFYEHIVTSDAAYDKIKWYIANNIAQWAGDSLNPDRSQQIAFPRDTP